jgi:ABC-2 type transport system permease protein
MRASMPYLAGLISGIRRAIASPDELLVRMIFYGIVLVVFAALWRSAMHVAGGSIEGYDLNSILWYVAGGEAVVVALKPRMIESIGDEIGTGDVAAGLLRPVSFVGFRLSVELGEALVRLLGCAVVAATVGTALQGPPPSVTGVLVYVPSALLALCCNLAAQHAFGGIAFWLEDARAGWFLYQKLIFLLGGMLLPFELLPDALATIARVLPFGAMAYAPARQLSGHVEPQLLLLQVFWLVVLGAVALGVFRAGERRLVVVGG